MDTTNVTSPSHGTINVLHQNVNHSMVDLPHDSSFNNSMHNSSQLLRLNAKLVKPRQSLAQFNQSRYLGKNLEDISVSLKIGGMREGVP